jgi:hypothetical protein
MGGSQRRRRRDTLAARSASCHSAQMLSASNATERQRRAAARRRQRARRPYRPPRVRLLLIGESPPRKDLDRYFYLPEVARADYLFAGVVRHLLAAEPERGDKRPQLAALHDLGVFLIDLQPDPCDPRPRERCVGNLVGRAKREAPEHAILIGAATVYDIAHEALVTGGMPVVHERVPFPLGYRRRQAEFDTAFKDALLRARMKSRAPAAQHAV